MNNSSLYTTLASRFVSLKIDETELPTVELNSLKKAKESLEELKVQIMAAISSAAHLTSKSASVKRNQSGSLELKKFTKLLEKVRIEIRVYEQFMDAELKSSGYLNLENILAEGAMEVNDISPLSPSTKDDTSMAQTSEWEDDHKSAKSSIVRDLFEATHSTVSVNNDHFTSDDCGATEFNGVQEDGMYRLTALEKISSMLSSFDVKNKVGLVTAIEVGIGYIFVGTSRGFVLVFDFKQKFVSCLGDESQAIQSGGVKTMALMKKKNTLVVSYENTVIGLVSLDIKSSQSLRNEILFRIYLVKNKCKENITSMVSISQNEFIGGTEKGKVFLCRIRSFTSVEMLQINQGYSQSKERIAYPAKVSCFSDGISDYAAFINANEFTLVSLGNRRKREINNLYKVYNPHQDNNFNTFLGVSSSKASKSLDSRKHVISYGWNNVVYSLLYEDDQIINYDAFNLAASEELVGSIRIIAFYVLNERLISIFTKTDVIILGLPKDRASNDLKVIEKAQFDVPSVDGFVDSSLFLRRIFVLSNESIIIWSLLNYNERLEIIKTATYRGKNKENSLHEAISTGVRLYNEQDLAVWYSPREQSASLRTYLEDAIFEYMTKPSVQNDTNEMSFLVESLISIGSNIEEVYRKIASMLQQEHLKDCFLEQVMRYIAGGKILKFDKLSNDFIHDLVLYMTSTKDIRRTNELQDALVAIAANNLVDVDYLSRISKTHRLFKLLIFLYSGILNDYTGPIDFIVNCESAQGYSAEQDVAEKSVVFLYLIFLFNMKQFPTELLVMPNSSERISDGMNSVINHLFDNTSSDLVDKLMKLNAKEFLSACSVLLINYPDQYSELVVRTFEEKFHALMNDNDTNLDIAGFLIKFNYTKILANIETTETFMQYLLGDATNFSHGSPQSSKIELSLIILYQNGTNTQTESFFGKYRSIIEARGYFKLLKAIYLKEKNYEKLFDCLVKLDLEEDLLDYFYSLTHDNNEPENASKLKQIKRTIITCVASKASFFSNYKRLADFLYFNCFTEKDFTTLIQKIDNEEVMFELLKEVAEIVLVKFQGSENKFTPGLNFVIEKFLCLVAKFAPLSLLAILKDFRAKAIFDNFFRADVVLKGLSSFDLPEVTIFLYEESGNLEAATEFILKKVRDSQSLGDNHATFNFYMKLAFSLLSRNSSYTRIDSLWNLLLQNVVEMHLKEKVPQFSRIVNQTLTSVSTLDSVFDIAQKLLRQKMTEEIMGVLTTIMNVLKDLSTVNTTVSRITKSDLFDCLLKRVRVFKNCLKPSKDILTKGCALCSCSLSEKIEGDTLAWEHVEQIMMAASKLYKKESMQAFSHFPEISLPVLKAPPSTSSLIFVFGCNHAYHCYCLLRHSGSHFFVCPKCNAYEMVPDIKRMKGKNKAKLSGHNSFDEINKLGLSSPDDITFIPLPAESSLDDSFLEAFYLSTAIMSHPSRLPLVNEDFDE